MTRDRRLLAAEAGPLLDRFRAYPPVRTAPHRDGPKVYRTAAEALRASALQAGPRSGSGPDGAEPSLAS